MESANIEIEFSLSPTPGLRQFSSSVEIDQYDKIFALLYHQQTTQT
jgi:hypothetical protein